MGDELDRKYGKPGTPERPQFDEKARAWCKCMNDAVGERGEELAEAEVMLADAEQFMGLE